MFSALPGHVGERRQVHHPVAVCCTVLSEVSQPPLPVSAAMGRGREMPFLGEKLLLPSYAAGCSPRAAARLLPSSHCSIDLWWALNYICSHLCPCPPPNPHHLPHSFQYTIFMCPNAWVYQTGCVLSRGPSVELQLPNLLYAHI